ncbi:transposase IS116/IS110/ IS902 family protein [Wolbachia endosymbiont of Armadillidium vulgare str. wVulC]|uniref:Transposase n=1 Tax=Wolbachia endosymbiont of Armadillidium arcangelii TaxID=3158571 RepID=A0AAU7Q4A0_9RICK|nr:hypothetical protein [Wolbachia endosymbiont of Armadillidium vulgare]KLT23302.1 transposase IS116/IS110/ IS902 family protein [Wolbachia endosymbiont of Armadillidium vulgare str. wVulC]KLT23387.1 transposase IS116/IS110/ IS902 family protein [Wolbachia endosymbiont of Armadillidium vulgare str. wVulC]OJH30879.1 hypothetical protein Wxf_00245 [Wolbachia endosymbiont of Armadillidium vulgare]OJH31333.1 hypothetical protein Wxf_00722 [Wolbachia endosymbiont of Armadillidium vulgare]OJH32356.
MKHYSGLDVSLKETFISIIDEKGKIVKEGVVASESSAIADWSKQKIRVHRNRKRAIINIDVQRVLDYQ